MKGCQALRLVLLGEGKRLTICLIYIFYLFSILITKSITMFYFNNCLLFCTESLTMNILLRGFLFLNCIAIFSISFLVEDIYFFYVILCLMGFFSYIRKKSIYCLVLMESCDVQVILKNLPPNLSLINDITDHVKEFLMSKALLKGDPSTISHPLRRLRGETVCFVLLSFYCIFFFSFQYIYVFLLVIFYHFSYIS